MPFVKITDLPAPAIALTASDPLPAVTLGNDTTVKITLGDLQTFIQQTTAQVYAGAGDPNGVVSAFYGSIYVQDNGSFWRKSTAGFSNTGWV